jgi:8-oxo-dGTP pyrophosphatase MutT (NUDIX family)
VGYVGSYLWSIRQHVGQQLVLMPGAQVVLVDDHDRILFQRRLDTGLWEFPAGASEQGSSFASTAVAELFEETGIRVAEQDLTAFGCLSDPAIHVVRYPNGDLTHCFAMCYEARVWDGSLVLEAAEVTEAAFQDPRTPPTPLHRPTAVVLDMWLQFRCTGEFQNR